MIGHLYRYPHPFKPDTWIYVGQGLKRHKQHRLGNKGFGKRFKKLFPGVELPQPTREQVDVYDGLALNEEETIWMFRFHTWHSYPDGMNLTLPGSLDYKKNTRLAGLVGGRKAFTSGRLVRMRNLPQTKRAQRLGGLKKVRSGELERMRNLPQTKKAQRAQGRIQGRINTQNGSLKRARGLAYSKEAQKARRISGLERVKSGQMDWMRNLPQSKEAQRLSGARNGRKNVESGQLTIARCIRWFRLGKTCFCGKHSTIREK